ncbi:hypothetical protein AMECASPLE_019949 [Ameca splendens]|uniref:Uncharacterized protein n=1 Tax=Ameca splendens TaxID=208324 RepID=A0ABV0ZN92_9TELE
MFSCYLTVLPPHLRELVICPLYCLGSLVTSCLIFLLFRSSPSSLVHTSFPSIFKLSVFLCSPLVPTDINPGIIPGCFLVPVLTTQAYHAAPSLVPARWSYINLTHPDRRNHTPKPSSTIFGGL